MKKSNILILLLILLLVAGTFFVAISGIKIGSFEVKPVKDQLKLGLDIKGGVVVVYEAKTKDNLETAVNQTIQILGRRINQLGLTEPIITKQGDDRIRIELPGVNNASEAVQIIGKTAQLEFLLVKNGSNALQGMTKTAFEYEPVLTGENVASAGLDSDQYGHPAVGLQLDDKGAELFRIATEKALAGTESNGQIAIVLDGEVISAPMVSSVIPNGRAIITGSFTVEAANNLALLIRGGALPVELEEAYVSEIGPTLGLGAFNSAVFAGFIGLIAVAVIMIVAYRFPGLIATIALSIYVLVIVYSMIGFNATLTLPGIAGIVISFGMAVDANVIIFERIKEELRNKKSIRASISAGFKRGMSTVLDSNVTTFIAALVLFFFGDGPIKGFAVTLMLGIAASMLTAVLVTHYMLKLSVGFVNSLGMYGVKEGVEPKVRNYSLVQKHKVAIALSLAVIIAGFGMFAFKQFNYGIDFTGGTMLQINMHKEVNRADIEADIASFNLAPQIVHAGSGNEQVVIKTTEKLNVDKRLEVFHVLKDKYGLDKADFVSSEQFSASVSNDIKLNAFLSILIASVLMLVYITLRFEIVFGIGAIVSLFHDVLILLAVYALFRLPVNSSFIASILTVVGYSINDTIVIYDRIRGDLKRERTKDYVQLANVSVNRTLTRTIYTSVTTIVVICSLYIFGSPSIQEFALPLLVGVTVGTYSSIFVASGIWAVIRNYVDNKGRYNTGK